MLLVRIKPRKLPSVDALIPDSAGEKNTELESFVLQEVLTVQHLASSFQERD